MTRTVICPNPNCRTRLQIQLPAPGRIHCPRCHEPVTLNPNQAVAGNGGEGQGGLSGDSWKRAKSVTMPGWMLAVSLLLLFVSGASGLVMVLNYWHLTKGVTRTSARAAVPPFQSNIRFSAPQGNFNANRARGPEGWIQDWSRPDGGRLLVGVDDLPDLRPAVEDLEAMTLARLDVIFPEGRFHLALKKREGPGLIAGEPSMAAWDLEVTEADGTSTDVETPELSGRLFGAVAVVARRGFVYWFVDLWPNSGSAEGADCWSRVEWGTDRENWHPTPQRELNVAVAGSSLTLNPEVWRLLEGAEKEAFLKSVEGEPASGQPASPFRPETILQGRKKRQGAQDSGLKTNAVLQAITVPEALANPEEWVREWENSRASQNTFPEGGPVVKLVPLTGQADMYRSTVNGETEELVLLVRATGGKLAWIATCQFQERSEWVGEFARIRRSLNP